MLLLYSTFVRIMFSLRYPPLSFYLYFFSEFIIIRLLFSIFKENIQAVLFFFLFPFLGGRNTGIHSFLNYENPKGEPPFQMARMLCSVKCSISASPIKFSFPSLPRFTFIHLFLPRCNCSLRCCLCSPTMFIGPWEREGELEAQRTERPLPPTTTTTTTTVDLHHFLFLRHCSSFFSLLSSSLFSTLVFLLLYTREPPLNSLGHQWLQPSKMAPVAWQRFSTVTLSLLPLSFSLSAPSCNPSLSITPYLLSPISFFFSFSLWSSWCLVLSSLSCYQ